jgi:hypothetical protein
MKHEDKVKAIQFIRPNAEFALTGDELEWRDQNQTEPTQAEIEAGLIAYKKAQDAELKAQDQAKEAAQAKLAALGLTVEDLQALGL